MTPITNKKLFQTTPIIISSNFDDDERGVDDANSIRANSVTTATVYSGNDDNRSWKGDSSEILEPSIEQVDSISPSCLAKDAKNNNSSFAGRPPVPKAQKFYESSPVEISSFNDGNSILSSTKSTAGRASSSSSGLPPKPEGVRHSGTSTISNNSTCGRHSLRTTISSRRHSLTHQEAKFLEELIRTGNDIDIQRAYERLLDEDLFFDPSDSNLVPDASLFHVSDFKLDASINASVRSCIEFADLQTIMTASSTSTNPDEILRSTSIAGSHASSQGVLGSERRQEHLEVRRKSVTQKIWRAHENGLAVSKHASRRSVALRLESSIGSANSSSRTVGGFSRRERWYSQQKVGNDSIFRTRRPTSPLSSSLKIGGGLMDDIRSDNNRRTARLTRRSSYSSSLGMMGVRGPAIPPTIPKQQLLRRLNSETNITSSGKSVTFATIPHPTDKGGRTVSEGNVQKRPGNFIPSKAHAERRGSDLSLSSLPSLHLANEVMSPTSSVISTASSRYPSIHLAHGVFSNESVGEEPQEEKKSSDTWDEANNDLLKAKLTGSTNYQPGIQDVTKVLGSELATEEDEEIHRTVIVRRASVSDPGIEGIEVADWETEQVSPSGILSKRSDNSNNNILETRSGRRDSSGSDFDILGASNAIQSWHRTSSFDDSLFLIGGGISSDNFNNTSTIFRHSIRRSLSDESVGFRVFTGRTMLMDDSLNSASVRDLGNYSAPYLEDESGNIISEVSWKMEEREDEDNDDGNEGYDAWKVIEDEYENGYGGGGTLPFVILGTSADDIDAHPHVLSPPLMESLLAFVPYGNAGDNYWMKYSLVRDGASLHSFLQYARGARYSFLAIETVDGEVFGSFTATPWRKNWNYFGTGEAFLWRMKRSRLEKSHSIIDQAQLESEIEVYPYTGANNCIQLCTQDRIAVGGGTSNSSTELTASLSIGSSADKESIDKDNTSSSFRIKENEWGFGLTIENDFLHGTSSPCLTFGSPSLSTIHPDGSMFEIMNLELWALTPCTNLEDAEKLEMNRLFLEKHIHI